MHRYEIEDIQISAAKPTVDIRLKLVPHRPIKIPFPVFVGMFLKLSTFQFHHFITE